MTSSLRWIGLALLGILIAAAISVAASRLASQQIGLDSQPISAGDALAPAGSSGERRLRATHPCRDHEPAPPALQPEPQPEPPAVPATPAPAPRPEGRDETGGSGSSGGGDD
jgi:hypothetical protein